MAEPILMTTTQIGLIVGITRQAVYRRIMSGSLMAERKANRFWLIDPDSLAHYRDRRTRDYKDGVRKRRKRRA
jgi:hypothetical protein